MSAYYDVPPPMAYQPAYPSAYAPQPIACPSPSYGNDCYRPRTIADRPLFQATHAMGREVEACPPGALLMPVAFAADAVDLVTRPIQGLFGAIFGGHDSGPRHVADVQRRLAARGFDPGPIDGEWGPQTARALAAFQWACGLPATGQLDRATRARL